MKLGKNDLRCHGDADSDLCKQCARKQQIERDDNTETFKFTNAKPTRGQCILFIREQDKWTS
jgi:hypothetical protein